MAQVKTIALRAPATIVYPSGAARATPRRTDRAICLPTLAAAIGAGEEP